MKPSKHDTPSSTPRDPSKPQHSGKESQTPSSPGRDQIRQTVPVRAPRQSERPTERSK